MRIAIIDDSAARVAIIREGLESSGLSDIHILNGRHGLVAKLEQISPDVILMDLANPSRDTLEESFLLSKIVARPVAMFVDSSDDNTIGEAVDAGVSAYIVDGLKKERIRSVLELAVRRFNAFSRLQSELDEARTALAERNSVDQAKRLLMKKRNIDEPAAYALLRKTAMDGGKRISDVAEALLTAEKLLGGE